MLSFKCKDVGLDCQWEAMAETEDELMQKIAEHAAEEHDMNAIPPDMMAKVKEAIKE